MNDYWYKPLLGKFVEFVGVGEQSHGEEVHIQTRFFFFK